MKFTILINKANSHTAYLFSQAVLAEGHEIQQVFFYGDAVYDSNKLCELPQDEINLTHCWQQLQNQHQLKINICIAAATRRGINETNLADGFTISSLGELMTAINSTDRFITFN